MTSEYRNDTMGYAASPAQRVRYAAKLAACENRAACDALNRACVSDDHIVAYRWWLRGWWGTEDWHARYPLNPLNCGRFPTYDWRTNFMYESKSVRAWALEAFARVLDNVSPVAGVQQEPAQAGPATDLGEAAAAQAEQVAAQIAQQPARHPDLPSLTAWGELARRIDHLEQGAALHAQRIGRLARAIGM